jgi:hypothetical protein
MTPAFYQILMEVVGVIVLSAFGFYAARLLDSFRRGMLERGWKLVAAGAIVLVLAQIPFLLGAILSYPLFMVVGNITRFAGIILLALGFRAQSKIWRVDKKLEPDMVRQ